MAGVEEEGDGGFGGEGEGGGEVVMGEVMLGLEVRLWGLERERSWRWLEGSRTYSLVTLLLRTQSSQWSGRKLNRSRRVVVASAKLP